MPSQCLGFIEIFILGYLISSQDYDILFRHFCIFTISKQRHSNRQSVIKLICEYRKATIC